MQAALDEERRVYRVVMFVSGHYVAGRDRFASIVLGHTGTELEDQLILKIIPKRKRGNVTFRAALDEGQYIEDRLNRLTQSNQ